MTVTRRDFIKAGAAAAAVAAIPRPLRAADAVAMAHVRAAAGVRIDDPRVRELALRAVEAARSAGALYADVRLTHRRGRTCAPTNGVINESERLHVGVRALVNGYWGFASSAYWTPDEVTRVARAAVGLARTNALGRPRTVDLAPAPVVAEGHWEMPVKVDPFTVPIEEVFDLGNGLAVYAASAFGAVQAQKLTFDFAREAKAFASTDGSFLTQTTYRTSGDIQFPLSGGVLSVDTLTPAGLGWEYVRSASLYDDMDRAAAQLDEDSRLPVKPVQVGRYDVVFDAESMAGLLDGTIGAATELDRAMGYEANAGGTSYLNDPVAMLGSYQVGAPLLTVTANRSLAGGLATVKWDDEGVAPDECALVKNGILTDFQTTRESAGWLAEAYAKAGRPVRSHGCAGAPSAGDVTMPQRPNLVLAPGREALGFDALVAATPRGIAIRRATINGDFNSVGGTGLGDAFEIRNGKRVARIRGAGFLFRAPDLWKGLLAVGGAASARTFGVDSEKGEPLQQSWHSVSAVPARIRQLTVIDIVRKS